MYVLSPCGKFKYRCTNLSTRKSQSLLNSATVVFEPSELLGNNCDLRGIPMISFKGGLQITLFGDKVSKGFNTGATSKLPEKVKKDLIASKDRKNHYIQYYKLKDDSELLEWAKKLVAPYGLTCCTSINRNNLAEDRKKIVDFFSGRSEYLNLSRF